MIRKITRECPLKIISFTDTHLDDHSNCFDVTLKLMVETIRTEKPDLVVFVGDNVTGGENRTRTDIFQNTMTDLKVPWAPVLGNHEGDNPMSMLREEMVEAFKRSPYCMIPQEKTTLADGTLVHGDTNYAIPLLNEEGKTCFKLLFLDGGTDMTIEEMENYGLEYKGKLVDNCLKESQIAWYREQVKEDECPSMVFCHIPLPEFKEAREKGKHLAGVNYEGVCCSPFNSGMFDVMRKKGKSLYYVAGHDHVNASRILYQGIQLIYNRMSGFSSYNTISKKLDNKLMQGCSVYYIDADGRVGFADILYEDRYPQYHDEIYSVIRK